MTYSYRYVASSATDGTDGKVEPDDGDDDNDDDDVAEGTKSGEGAFVEASIKLRNHADLNENRSVDEVNDEVSFDGGIDRGGTRRSNRISHAPQKISAVDAPVARTLFFPVVLREYLSQCASSIARWSTDGLEFHVFNIEKFFRGLHSVYRKTGEYKLDWCIGMFHKFGLVRSRFSRTSATFFHRLITRDKAIASTTRLKFNILPLEQALSLSSVIEAGDTVKYSKLSGKFTVMRVDRNGQIKLSRASSSALYVAIERDLTLVKKLDYAAMIENDTATGSHYTPHSDSEDREVNEDEEGGDSIYSDSSALEFAEGTSHKRTKLSQQPHSKRHRQETKKHDDEKPVDFVRAWSILNNPMKWANETDLKHVLDENGISESDELKYCDRDILNALAECLKVVPQIMFKVILRIESKEFLLAKDDK
jgi:hypothetical protein